MKVKLKKLKENNIGNAPSGKLFIMLDDNGNYKKGDIIIKSIGGKLINLRDGNGWENPGVVDKLTPVRILENDEEVILSNE